MLDQSGRFGYDSWTSSYLLCALHFQNFWFGTSPILARISTFLGAKMIFLKTAVGNFVYPIYSNNLTVSNILPLPAFPCKIAVMP